MKDTPAQVSHLWSPLGCNIRPSATGLTSIMAQRITWIVAEVWPPAFIPVSNLIYGLSPGHSNLGTQKKITTACSIAALLISRFFPPKRSEASFKRAQSVNKNCLTTSPLQGCSHWLTRFHLSSQKWILLWTTFPKVADSSRILVKCGCKKGCKGNCKCRKAVLDCTALCNCGGSCN